MLKGERVPRCLCLPVLVAAIGLTASGAAADDVLYRYEGDVLPYDESAGWINGNPCEDPCSASVENGRFVLRWAVAGDSAAYGYRIAVPGEAAPDTLWVEWRFRSNHPLGPNFYTCDGAFSVKYGGMDEIVFMYGDAAISFSAADFVLGLDIDEFHTYRFESLDGINYTVAVDGLTFITSARNSPNGFHTLALRGEGGCLDDKFPNMLNEWDFIRFGTISDGERIVVTDPPGGFLDAREHAALDCFTVTFDSPNYVYMDEISVEVTGGVAPVVTQTRRRENDEPDSVEIVLDRPLPAGETTRFTLDDGVAVNVVEYTFAPGDTDGDGDADLLDAAAFLTCFGQSAPTSSCWALDTNRDDLIDLADYAALQSALTGP